jgi:translation initiation factor 5B
MDRFDRIQSFGSTIVGVPVSAATGEGIPELLAILSGLSQQFLNERLQVTGQAKGNILEVKPVSGLGTTIDVIVYDGTLKKNEFLVIGGTRPRITKIRALLQPEPMRDIRTEKKFLPVEEVHAAGSVKISAPGLDDVIAGSPVMSAPSLEKAESLFEQMEKMEEIEISSNNEGLILRADTVGSLEALIHIFRKYQIKNAAVGRINRESVIKAEANKMPKNKSIIAFNMKPDEDVAEFAKDKNVDILYSNRIYRLEEDYEKLVKKKEEDLKKEELAHVTHAGKIKILPGLTFRANNPAVVGCEIVGGIIKAGYSLFKASGPAGKIKQIQSQGETVEEAGVGDKIAVSITGVTMGRQIKENDILFTDITENDYKMLMKYPLLMQDSERKVLEEILELKRKQNKFWGM